MFYPIQIQACPGFGFQGGPEFSTNIQDIQSGREKRNGDWAICRHKYSVPFNNITDEAYRAIKEVFLITRGRLHTFLHKDWADFEASNEEFATGDGTTKIFQLSKTSSLGGGSYLRTITKPALGAAVTVDGVPASPTVDPATGLVTFTVAPADGAILRWSGEFFVQVRFDMDYLPYSLDNVMGGGNYASNGSCDLLEVLGE